MRNLQPGEVNPSQAARDQARQRLNAARGELVQAANDIAKKYLIPEQIGGHTAGGLVGRITFVPSQGRELLVIATNMLAQDILREMMAAPAPAPVPTLAADPVPAVGPTALDAPEPVRGQLNYQMDIELVPGLQPRVVQALKQAGYIQLADIVDVPSEHLVKIQGVGEASIVAIREAIQQAATNASGQQVP